MAEMDARGPALADAITPDTTPPETARLSFSQTRASVWLDLVRGLAALLVMGAHWRGLLFVDYPTLVSGKRLLTIPYLITGCGLQAVTIFFVLSGYLISRSIYRAVERNEWTWKRYMTHRLVRLWLVLIPGLALCSLWDHLGIRLSMRLHHAPLFYAALNSHHVIDPVIPFLGWKVFFGNLFYLQPVYVHTFGSDGALWSLSFELWYYILFPLGLLLLLRRGSIAVLALYGVLLVAILWFVGPAIRSMFPVWLLGALLARMPVLRLGRAARWAAAILYLPLLVGLAKQRVLSAPVSGDLLAVATFFFLWILLSATGRADPEARNVVLSRTLARFSFTLYVVHMPFLVLLTSLLVGETRWSPDPRHISIALSMLLATLLYAYGLAWITEFRTDTVRRWVERKLGIGAEPASSAAVAS